MTSPRQAIRGILPSECQPLLAAAPPSGGIPKPVRIGVLITGHIDPVPREAGFVDADLVMHIPAIANADSRDRERCVERVTGGFISTLRTVAIAQLARSMSRILRGESAGDIPVDPSPLLEFVINLNARQFAEFGVRTTALQRADRVLE